MTWTPETNRIPFELLTDEEKTALQACKRGWEPDWGMDHTEAEAHLYLAQRIVEALTGESHE